jgi:hypothetical protein
MIVTMQLHREIMWHTFSIVLLTLPGLWILTVLAYLKTAGCRSVQLVAFPRSTILTVSGIQPREMAPEHCITWLSTFVTDWEYTAS